MSERARKIAKNTTVSVGAVIAILFAAQEAFQKVHSTARAEAIEHAEKLDKRIDGLETSTEKRLDRIENKIDAILMHEGLRPYQYERE